MIFDQLSNVENYRGLFPHLDTAIDYIMHHDLHSLPLGRTEVAGSDVYINVMEASAGPVDTKQYEFHKHYMDIQIDLEGTERVLTGDGAHMEIISYDPGVDCGFAHCRNLADCLIGPGNFILCMAEEPHMPGASHKLKKCVFKVHI